MKLQKNIKKTVILGESMKILYITTSLLRNESASIRNISLINGIVENGNEVDILTLNFLEKFEDKFLKTSLTKEARIYKVKITKFNKIFSIISNKRKEKSKNFKFILKLKNIIKEFLFFPDIYSESIENSKEIVINKDEYDFIVSSSDSKSSHFIAKNIIKNNNLIQQWVQIWGDPWGNDINVRTLNFLTKYRIKKEEKKLLEKATKIFYISELTSETIKNKYPLFSNKIFTLNRSYLKEINSKNEQQKFIFSYTGSILNRNIIPLIDSIEKYNENNDKKIELNFYGINEQDFNFDILNKNFIKIFSRVSFEEVLEVYKNSDVLVYIDNLYNSTQIPGKIYDYFGTNKTILGLYESEDVKETLKKYDRIELIRNQGIFELNSVIKSINTKNVMEKFSPKNIAKDFIEKIINN